MDFSEKAKALVKLKALDKEPWIKEKTEINNADDDRLIMVIGSNSANFIEQESIAKILAWLMERQLVILVACDGAWAVLDTKLSGPELLEKYSNIENVHPELIQSLFSNMSLSPQEYSWILSPRSFILFGADDKDLYKKAFQLYQAFVPLREDMRKKEFWKMSESELSGELNNAPQDLTQKMYEFYDLEKTRAHVILENLLNRMNKEQPPLKTAVLLCYGALPILICAEMVQRRISYARIKVNTEIGGPALEKYEERLKSKLNVVETL